MKTERWTMFRRLDWEHDHGSLVAHGAPAPVPYEQLEVFDVVRADSVECADGWTHAAKIGPLQAEVERLRAALVRCATVSGADVSDGPPTWPSVDEWAVQEVQRLRDDYDDSDNAR